MNTYKHKPDICEKYLYKIYFGEPCKNKSFWYNGDYIESYDCPPSPEESDPYYSKEYDDKVSKIVKRSLKNFHSRTVFNKIIYKIVVLFHCKNFTERNLAKDFLEKQFKKDVGLNILKHIKNTESLFREIIDLSEKGYEIYEYVEDLQEQTIKLFKLLDIYKNHYLKD